MTWTLEAAALRANFVEQLKFLTTDDLNRDVEWNDTVVISTNLAFL